MIAARSGAVEYLGESGVGVDGPRQHRFPHRTWVVGGAFAEPRPAFALRRDITRDDAVDALFAGLLGVFQVREWPIPPDC
jgi:hypothetical protein